MRVFCFVLLVLVSLNQCIPYQVFNSHLHPTNHFMVMANPASNEGPFVEETEVELISSLPEATIYYTLDGSFPDIDSKVYKAPIVIKKNSTLNFFAIAPNSNSPYNGRSVPMEEEVESIYFSEEYEFEPVKNEESKE